MQELQKQGLLNYVRGTGEKILQYLSSSILVKTLENVIPREPNNVEQIAIGLAVSDPEKITKEEMIVCIQIAEALKQHESKKSLIEGWAAKARMSQQNPGSIEYLTSIGKTRAKEEDKMEGVIRRNVDAEPQIIGAKKRRQEETLSENEKKEQLMTITNIEVPSVEAGPSKQNLRTEGQNEEETTNENLESESKGKKLKKSQELSFEEETTTPNRIQKQDTNSVQPKVSLENSVWAPKNRLCNKKNSFKAKISSCKVPGDNKEYRVNYMKWVFRGNAHVKSIKEDFINRNS